jgi:hypothetical protein
MTTETEANPSKATPVPSEYQECVALAQWLDRHGIVYTHVPMGGLRDRKSAAKLKRMGAKAGVPDYLIFSSPPLLWTQINGVAIEMKRRAGGTMTVPQRSWLADLGALGWWCMVARGAEDAIERLRSLGYGPQD